MKKFLSVLLVSALVFSIGAIAFADGEGTVPQWFKDKMDWKRDRIDEGVKNGDITEEQAKEYKEHLNEMEEYRNENGFKNEGFNGPGMGFRKGHRNGNGNRLRDGSGFNENCPNF